MRALWTPEPIEWVRQAIAFGMMQKKIVLAILSPDGWIFYAGKKGPIDRKLIIEKSKGEDEEKKNYIYA